MVESRRMLSSMALGSAFDSDGAVACLRGQRLRSECRALDPAIVERLAPELFEVSAGVLLLPVGADEIVSGGIGLAGE